jgi:PAS domain S-box-containing protein
MPQAQRESRWSALEPPGGLFSSLKNIPIRQYVAILLPLTILFVVGFLVVCWAEIDDEQDRIIASATRAVQNGVERSDRGLEIAAGDLAFLAGLVTETTEDGVITRQPELEGRLLAFAESRPSYLRIQVLAATGDELLRIERGTGRARAAARARPPGQREAETLAATMRLDTRATLATPSLPDAGPGADEVPVIRVSTPLDDEAGQRIGIVAVDVNLSHFLGGFEQRGDETTVQRMLVHAEDEHVAIGSEPGAGVRLAHGGRFDRTFPGVWSALAAKAGSWVERREGLYYLEPVRAPGLSNEGASARERPLWMLLSFVPRRLFDDTAFQIATRLLVFATPLFYVLLMLGCVLVVLLHRRDETVRALEASRDAMLGAALDGIVVMDGRGNTIDFNPSALRIFGYTREEVRGKLVADLIIPEAHREAHRRGLKRYLTSGEARIIDKHIDELTAIRKSGEEFPVELTVCRPVVIGRRRIFYGFLRDLSEARPEIPGEPSESELPATAASTAAL